MNMKHPLVFFFAFFLASVFAQNELEPEAGEPKKLAVYVFGSSDGGINKVFGSRLLAAIAQGGEYVGISDSEAFYDELAGNRESGNSQIIQAAKQHGADFVCVVSMTEVFGAYSITARIMKTEDSQIIRTSSLDRSLKSFDDLTAVSNELASLLLQRQTQPPPPSAAVLPPAAPLSPPPPAASSAAEKQCESTFNINELIFKVQSAFPIQLKDCSGKLAKNMALAASPLGKKSAKQEDPQTFMMQCAIDGIKKDLPLGAGEYVKNIEGFVQNLLNAASGAGGLDPKKLISAVGSMNISEFLDELKNQAASDACAVLAPFDPPVVLGKVAGEERKKDKSAVSFGLRAGLNVSHLYATYDDGCRNASGSYENIGGWQLGLVLDIALSDWFYIQPGLMYITKGVKDNHTSHSHTYDYSLTARYLEIPFLLSLKLSALRVNAGPYLGMHLGGDDSFFGSVVSVFGSDFGISMGSGFDIGMFYIGAFYNVGLTSMGNRRHYDYYNRTLGFNFGVNL
ncbi:MAG: PorT family protein [Fibromonadaceae bacterium]|jgi:hypothetical protein|nr:PorT family protein [Fibromonadaceae bacterium]